MNPAPFPSWTFNENIDDWEAPIPLPTLTDEDKKNQMVYIWNETNLNWQLKKFPNNNLYPYTVS